MDAPDVFVAGVIQGSTRRRRMVDQAYRARIKAIVEASSPGLRVYDPVENHPQALQYDAVRARTTFFAHLDLVRRSRALVAYLPEASLGTAVEMWEAYRGGVPVVTISPMRINWVVDLLSSVVCDDLDAFGAWASEGGLRRLVETGAGGRAG